MGYELAPNHRFTSMMTYICRGSFSTTVNVVLIQTPLVYLDEYDYVKGNINQTSAIQIMTSKEYTYTIEYVDRNLSIWAVIVVRNA